MKQANSAPRGEYAPVSQKMRSSPTRRYASTSPALLAWLSQEVGLVEEAKDVAATLTDDFGCTEPGDAKHLSARDMATVVGKHRLKKVQAGRLQAAWKKASGLQTITDGTFSCNTILASGRALTSCLS
jgi:hypothetical protein